MPASAYDVTNFDEADSLYNEFLKTMENYGEEDNEYSWLEYIDLEISRSVDYKKSTNKKQREFVDMQPKDKLLWYVTYIQIVCNISESDSYNDTILSQIDCDICVNYSFDQWKTIVCKQCWDMLNLQDYIDGNAQETDRSRAFSNLMEWSYLYFKQNRTVYNFIEKKDTSAYLAQYQTTDSVKVSSSKSEENTEVSSYVSSYISDEDTDSSPKTAADFLNEYYSQTNTEAHRKFGDALGWIATIIFFGMFITIPIITIYAANKPDSNIGQLLEQNSQKPSENIPEKIPITQSSEHSHASSNSNFTGVQHHTIGQPAASNTPADYSKPNLTKPNKNNNNNNSAQNPDLSYLYSTAELSEKRKHVKQKPPTLNQSQTRVEGVVHSAGKFPWGALIGTGVILSIGLFAMYFVSVSLLPCASGIALILFGAVWAILKGKANKAIGCYVALFGVLYAAVGFTAYKRGVFVDYSSGAVMMTIAFMIIFFCSYRLLGRHIDGFARKIVCKEKVIAEICDCRIIRHTSTNEHTGQKIFYTYKPVFLYEFNGKYYRTVSPNIYKHMSENGSQYNIYVSRKCPTEIFDPNKTKIATDENPLAWIVLIILSMISLANMIQR